MTTVPYVADSLGVTMTSHTHDDSTDEPKTRPADAQSGPPLSTEGPYPPVSESAADGVPVRPGPAPAPALAPGAVRLGPDTYLNPSTGRASFVPMDLALAPVAPIGVGPLAAVDDARMMQVRAETLDAFRGQVQRAYQEAFGAASSPAAPARFTGETSIVPRQLGGLTEAGRVHAAYQPLQQQMRDLLSHLDQLIVDVHTRIGRTNEQYQFSEQAASDALNAVRERR